jgi:hypothetical protein
MDITRDYTIQYSKMAFENVINQNRKCIKYIGICFMPAGIRRKLVNVLQRNANYLDFYYYTIDDYIYNHGIRNDDFNVQLKQEINTEFNKVSAFLDTYLWFY